MNPIGWHQIVLPLVVCAAFVPLAVRLPRYRFVLLGLGALVGYAALQDQVSARLCPEYFTVLHPPIPGLTDPTLLGISWGFLGAWWGGVVLGYGLGLTATVGPRPPLPLRELRLPTAVFVGGLGSVTGLTGFTVWHHARLLGVSLDGGMAGLVPPENHRALFTVACYHFTAYTAASIGGVLLCMWVWVERRRRPTTEKRRCPGKSSG